MMIKQACNNSRDGGYHDHADASGQRPQNLMGDHGNIQESGYRCVLSRKKHNQEYINTHVCQEEGGRHGTQFRPPYLKA